MPASQRVVQVCLFLVAAIAMFGGTVQFILGQPDTTPRLDNVHRFMAGVYFSAGVINLWAALTIRRQGTLVYLLALGVLLAGLGRLVSISQVGLPEPAAVWLGYLIPELLLPFVIVVAHVASQRGRPRADAVADLSDRSSRQPSALSICARKRAASSRRSASADACGARRCTRTRRPSARMMRSTDCSSVMSSM